MSEKFTIFNYEYDKNKPVNEILIDIISQIPINMEKENQIMKYPDLMVDIETLGVNPGEAIVSVAAIPFNIKTGEISISSTFYEVIDVSQEKLLKLNPETILWWMKQDKEAIDSFISESVQRLPTREVLEKLSLYIKEKNPQQIWGNSASFDLGLLDAAYRVYGIERPWNYYNERDVRTLVSFAPHIKKQTPFDGVRHNPVSDCHHQIKYCHRIYKTIFEHFNG